MKTVCAKHYCAYEMGVGCPWCEPAATPTGKVELPERTLEWAERLVKGPTFMRLMNDGKDVTQGFLVTPTRTGSVWLWSHEFRNFEGQVTGIALYDAGGARQYEYVLQPVNIQRGFTLDASVTLTF